MALTNQLSAAFRKINTALAAIWSDKQDVLGYVPEDVAAKNRPNGYAGLTGDGVLSTAVLPALALTATFETINEAAMLALVAQPGDVAIRQDENRCYILAAEPATVLANWKWLKTPTDLVLAVAGLTGTITAAALKAALSIPSKASAADLRAMTDAANYLTSKSVADAMAYVPLTDAATVAIDLSAGTNFTLLTTAAVGASRTLGAPTGAKPGQTFSIEITSDAANRSVAYHPVFNFPGGAVPPFTPTAGSRARLVGQVTAAGMIDAQLNQDMRR